MKAREKASLALSVLCDALDRVLYGYWTGTPREHVDRIDELLGRRPRGDVSRGQRPGPDDEAHKVKRWKRSTVRAHMASRRAHGAGG